AGGPPAARVRGRRLRRVRLAAWPPVAAARARHDRDGGRGHALPLPGSQGDLRGRPHPRHDVADLARADRAGFLAAGRQAAAALTGLGNRRRVMEDLELAVEHGVDGETTTLAFFDLDGFKHYNDSFGHAAGDALLSRLGSALAVTVADHGEAYRLGGDEFCLLLRGRFERGHPVLGAALQALSERGSGFAVSASCGAVMLPQEAPDLTGALKLADERMY